MCGLLGEPQADLADHVLLSAREAQRFQHGANFVLDFAYFIHPAATALRTLGLSTVCTSETDQVAADRSFASAA